MQDRMSSGDTSHSIGSGKRARFLLAILTISLIYALSGWLGLALKIPLGRASFIWPGSGVALAALLLYGRGLWPGVFLGSAIVNLLSSGAFVNGLDWSLVIGPLAISAGVTLQALFGVTLIRTIFGFPLRLVRIRQVLMVAVVAGPLSCLVAATIGTGTLYLQGTITAAAAFDVWRIWWLGDTVGVLMFLPIGILHPWTRAPSLYWRGIAVPKLNLTTSAYVAFSLVGTFLVWQTVARSVHNHNQIAFEAHAEDSQSAIINRLQSYEQSLDGAAGLFRASDDVTLTDWKHYVSALELSEHMPGLFGLGYIEAVDRSQEDAFLEQARRDQLPYLHIHPQSPGGELFVIKYSEPATADKNAVGRNIAADKDLFEAASLARDTGQPTITKSVHLKQQTADSAGFLLFRPMYLRGMPTSTPDERRAAFNGWIYTSFTAKSLLSKLSTSNDKSLFLTLYDGTEHTADQRVFSTYRPDASAFRSNYHYRKNVPVFNQTWYIEWDSTPAFEASTDQSKPIWFLYGGLLFSMLLGALISTIMRREQIVRDLVAEKTRELAEQVEQTRSIIDTANTGIMLLDGDGTVVSANEAVSRLFGYASHDLPGKPFSDLLSDPKLDAYLKRGAPPGNDRLQDLVSTRDKRGTPLYLDVQINSWGKEDGARMHSVIIRDLTEQQNAETQLRETEQRWDLALTSANIGVFDIDLNTGTSVVSATWKALLGIDPKSDIDAQKEWMRRVHPDDLAIVQASDNACIAGDTERSVSEYRMQLPDGNWHWMKADSVVVGRDSSGKALRMIGTQTDITELVQSKEDLRTSEEQFRTAIENSPVGMALVGLDGHWLKMNDAYCDFVGYDREELLKIGFLKLTYPDDRQEEIARIRKLIAGAATSFQMEARYVRKDAAIVWGFLSVAIVRDSHGRPLHFVTQINDITEQKKLDQTKSEFVSTVSHELRTPLTSVNGSLGLVLGAMAQDIPDKAVHLLTIAQKNCDRLIHLVNDILDMEKIASGNAAFTFVRANVAELLAQSVIANRPFFDQFGVTVDTMLSEEEAWCWLDVNRFQQIMANLLSNAAKFSHKGGKVEINLSVDETAIRVSVTDHGSGIPDGFRRKVFKPFSQADSSATREKGGTGLGLNISRQIVERMGGTIGFDTEVNKGTTFWFSLPRDTAASGGAITGDETKPNRSAGHTLSVLHIEDDTDFSEILAESFAKRAKIVNATTVKRAEALIRKRRFDLIVLDWELSDGNGGAILEMAGAICPDTPIITLTARESQNANPQILRNIIKSRTSLEDIVLACLKSMSPTDI